MRSENDRPIDSWVAKILAKSEEPIGELRADDSRDVDVEEIAQLTKEIQESLQRK